MKNNYRSHYHCVFELKYHLVLVTKYRRKCLTKKMHKRLEEIFESLFEKWDCKLVEFGAEEDHVHLLIEAHPSMQLSKFVNNLKTVSSRLIRKEFTDHLRKYYWKPVFWTRAYCILSAEGAPLEVIKNYIDKQGE